MALDFEKISKYDLSKSLTFVVLVVIFAIYFVFTIPELWIDECSGVGDCFDFDRRMARLAVWDFDWFQTDTRHFVHIGLITLSYQLFGNYKVLVLASSVLLLVVSYLFATVLSGKRLGGVAAILVVLQSTIFLKWDTSVTYPTFWALLFISSLYFVQTSKSYLSPIPYLFSIPAKALTALYFPGVLVYVWLNKKKKLFFVYLFMGLIGLVGILSLESLGERSVGGFLLIDEPIWDKFVLGFVSWMWKGFGTDQITLLIIIVSGFLLFLNRKKIKNSGPILSMLGTMVLVSPVLIGMTTYDVWPYRELCMVIVGAVITGIIVANLDKINLSMFTGKPTNPR